MRWRDIILAAVAGLLVGAMAVALFQQRFLFLNDDKGLWIVDRWQGQARWCYRVAGNVGGIGLRCTTTPPENPFDQFDGAPVEAGQSAPPTPATPAPAGNVPDWARDEAPK